MTQSIPKTLDRPLDAEQVQSDKATLESPLVAVYCGSKLGKDKIYQEAAIALGRQMAEANLGLVYGGASIGLMGLVADAVLESKQAVVGVIPEFMLDYEVAHDALTRLYITDNMHTRKAIMADYADAFITLPGGLGTLEEIMEIATWGQLYQHKKPMIILNVNNFYQRLLDHLSFVRDQGFMKSEDLDRLIVCQTVTEAVDMLRDIAKQDDNLDTQKI